MHAEPRRGERGLGRGLSSLIPAADPGVSTPPSEILLEAVRPNPAQPREAFSEEAMRSLVESVKEHGVLQPVLVMQSGDDGYVLIAGERRVRAARAAGLRTIPAVVRTANEQERLELALVENIQRSDLNAMEEARAFRRLIEEFGLTQEQVGRRVSRSRPAVANSIRLLDLAPEVQRAIEDGTISAGHGRALAGVVDRAVQVSLLAVVTARSLSVRETERLVADRRDPAALPSPRPSHDRPDPDVQHMEGRMRDALGTKVTITPGRRGGRITIAWYDDDDLGRLVERLSGARP
jgi:ParB family transcriptional regulator, chromosome partitioning protein